VLLLHDVFGYPYPEIASIIGKSDDNVRQLASRARRRVGERPGGVVRFQATREQQHELARRFFAAAEGDDLAGLEALLAHDVEMTADGGGRVPALARAVRGRSRVARTLLDISRRRAAFIPAIQIRPAEINGGPGALYLDPQQRLLVVVALELGGGQITGIKSIVNPDKLAHLGPTVDVDSLLRGHREALADDAGSQANTRSR